MDSKVVSRTASVYRGSGDVFCVGCGCLLVDGVPCVRVRVEDAGFGFWVDVLCWKCGVVGK